MKPEYYDIHSHLNFKQFDADREQVIATLAAEKIWTNTVGTSLETSREAVALAEAHEGIFATIGVHPADEAEAVFDESEFSKLAASKKVVAVGECGLDYARLPEGSEAAEKSRQKALFEQHIEFAVSHDMPLMIHCRDAYPDTLDLLRSKKREHGDKLRGNFHFFTSPVDIARACLEIGFTVSFTGPITYTTEYDEVVAFVPLEQMMAETDAPYAAPVPYRRTRNNPLYVVEVVKKIAQVKGLELEKTKAQLVKTALEVFLKDISSPSSTL